MNKILFFVGAFSLVSTAAFAEDISIEAAAKLVHSTSAGQLIRVYNAGAIIDSSAGPVTLLPGHTLVQVADVVCDFGKQWSAVGSGSATEDGVYCIAK